MTTNIVKQLALSNDATVDDLAAALRKRAPHPEFSEFEPVLAWQVPLAPHPEYDNHPQASLVGYIRPAARFWQPPTALEGPLACPMKRALHLHDAHLEIQDTTYGAPRAWTPVADLIPPADLADPDQYDGYPIPPAAATALQRQRDALVVRDVHMYETYDWLSGNLPLLPLLIELGVRDDLFVVPRRIAKLLTHPVDTEYTGTEADWVEDTAGAGEITHT